MSESEKNAYGNEWRTYRELNTNLKSHRGQAYSLVLGQHTQLLQDKTNHDTAWNATITSYNPLVLLQLIEKTALEQIEDQYPFETISMARNLPSTCFTKAQRPTHIVMRASKQRLMSPSPL